MAEIKLNLDIQKTEDAERVRAYTPKVVGKTSGLGICRYWAALFEANEKLPRRKKMTDEEIKRQMLLEFPIEDQPPRTQSALTKLGPVGQKGRSTVNEHRHLYNIGRYTGGKVPEVQSRRYGENGEVVCGRTGKPIAKDEENDE